MAGGASERRTLSKPVIGPETLDWKGIGVRVHRTDHTIGMEGQARP